MEINGVSPVSGPNQIHSVQSKTDTNVSPSAETSATTPQQDVVDVSSAQNAPGAAGASEAMDVTCSGVRVDGIRQDLVNRVRAEIAAGTYDTPEKMEIALERLLDNLGE